MINNVKLINKEYIANETLKFVFARPDGFDFRAGQFGDLTLINPQKQMKKEIRVDSRLLLHHMKIT